MPKRLWLVCVLAACGGSTKQVPIESRGGDESPSPSAAMNDPEAVLRALAQAARDDDGAALDALVHPTYGLWLWDQPGATVSPSVQVKAGSAEAPTAHLAASGMNDYWKENYWKAVAGSLDDGLTRLDRDPADRNAPIYGDCGADDSTGGTNLRAWLVENDDFRAQYGMLFEDEPMPFAAGITGSMVHYHDWGLDIWLVEDQGRLWVAHVMVWTPCDA
jgi:hypothetical protein